MWTAAAGSRVCRARKERWGWAGGAGVSFAAGLGECSYPEPPTKDLFFSQAS